MKDLRSTEVYNMNIGALTKLYDKFAKEYNRSDDTFETYIDYLEQWIRDTGGTKKSWIKEMKKKFIRISIDDTRFKGGMVYIWTYKDSVIYIGSTNRSYSDRYNYDFRTNTKLIPNHKNYQFSYKRIKLFLKFLERRMTLIQYNRNFAIYCYPTKDYEAWEAYLIAEFANHKQLTLNQKAEGDYELKLVKVKHKE